MSKRGVITNWILNAVMYFIIGVFLSMYPIANHDFLFSVIGIAFMVLGVIDILYRRSFSGALWLILGVASIVVQMYYPNERYFFIVAGVCVVLQGISSLFFALKPRNLGILIVAGVLILLGVLLIVGKWILADWYFIAIGVIFILSGIFRFAGSKLF